MLKTMGKKQSVRQMQKLEERLQEARRKTAGAAAQGKRARTAGACACGRMGNRR